LSFISIPNGYIVNLDQISIIKPSDDKTGISVFFSTGASNGNPPASKWMSTSFSGDEANAFLDSLDKQNIDTSFLRSAIKADLPQP